MQCESKICRPKMPLGHQDYLSRSKRESADLGRSPRPSCPHMATRRNGQEVGASCIPHPGSVTATKEMGSWHQRGPTQKTYSFPRICAVPPPATLGGPKPLPLSLAVSEAHCPSAAMGTSAHLSPSHSLWGPLPHAVRTLQASVRCLSVSLSFIGT